MTPQDFRPQTVRAHELLGDFWFNSDPVPVAALRGQVILLFFWDFASAGSTRAIPYVTEWSRKYMSFGLVVVGVHSPRFPFGKNPDSVQSALHRYNVQFPIVMDNESLIANRYEVRSCPSFILVDKDGFIRYRQEGDMSYAHTEHALQSLLYDAGVGEELPMLMDPLREIDRQGVVCYHATPELFAGYLRGSLGNVEGYAPESLLRYADPGMYLTGRFYAEGIWMNGRNALRCAHAVDTQGKLIVAFNAKEIDGVLGAASSSPIDVTVRQDERFLTPDILGSDVRIVEGGRSSLVVAEPRVYSLVCNRDFGEHVLTLTTQDDGLELYNFSFVTGIIPDLIPSN